MLKFATFTSDVELPFWTALASRKVNNDKLDDSARRLLGLYELRPTDPPETSCRMQIHANALTAEVIPNGFYRAEGVIRNVNTIEDYRGLDKTAILLQTGRTIWDAILDGSILSCPSLLASFSVICFADIKKYKFTYLFGFSALRSEPVWRVLRPINNHSRDSKGEIQDDIGYRISSSEASSLTASVTAWRSTVDSRQQGFFLAKRLVADSDSNESAHQPGSVPQRAQNADGAARSKWTVGSLYSFEHGFFDGVAEADQFVAFADPSTYPDYPGWMLRNLLVLIRQRWKRHKVQILCYREVQAQGQRARSIVLPLELDPLNIQGSDTVSASVPMPKVTGWERNSEGKIISKIANLAEYMDPHRLADQAVDLNLKLMKWRIVPTLNLDRIKATKCLLLGAGTLGSYGWGVRKITFIDNGSVSFSNPVRQPLFAHNDCLNGGVKKATRAAEVLKEIYPGVDSQGFVLSVPMAGHPIMDDALVKKDFDTLERLIKEHDAIFLLMDTRESRWLPTVIGKAENKIVMNAALGFDSYVVMHHGSTSSESSDCDLGCYFCNDVVAPADSMAYRTLDQQCTVTRPGVAPIASALLVEILVGLLQRLKYAPTSPVERSGSLSVDSVDQPLGVVPHQIRGFLADHQQMLVNGKSYDKCSACSKNILDAYSSDGWKFVQQALNEKGFVEELSGLAEVHRQAEKAMEEMEAADANDLEDDEELL